MSAAAERQFIQAAQQHGKGTLEGNPTSANDAYRELNASIDEIRSTPDRGEGFLIDQLKSDDPSVVIWSAYYLLPVREKEATEALEKISAKQIPRLSFGANMTLSEWKAGRLKIE